MIKLTYLTDDVNQSRTYSGGFLHIVPYDA